MLAAAKPYLQFLIDRIPAETPKAELEECLTPVLEAVSRRGGLEQEACVDAIVERFPVKRGTINALLKACSSSAKAGHRSSRKESASKADHSKTGSLPAVLSDAPVSQGIAVPAGWDLSDSGVSIEHVDYDDESGEEGVTLRLVAPAPIIIVGRMTDASSGIESTRIASKRDGAWRQHTVERRVLATAREIVTLSAYGLPVTSLNAGNVVQYLADFEAANLGVLPRARVSSRLGWQGHDGVDGFLWGNALITKDGITTVGDLETLAPDKWPPGRVFFRGADVGDEQIARAFHSAGSFADWADALHEVSAHPKVMLAFYASMAAVLLAILRAPNFIIDWCGPTTLGKTTALRVAGSCWGSPDEKAPASVLMGWDATRVAIERTSIVLNHLPMIIDETKRAKHPKMVGQAIYDFANGHGRARGSIQGTAHTGRWNTIMLTSGEAPAVSFTGDGGTRGRALTNWGSPLGKTDPKTAALVQRLNATLVAHYGHAGPQFVKFLIEHRAEWPSWREDYKCEKAAYAEASAGNAVAGRLGEYAAVIKIAARLIHQGLDLPWTCDDPVAPLWPELVAQAADADRAQVALAHVVSWASGNEHAFWGREQRVNGEDKIPPQGWAGAWKREIKWQEIAFLPHRLRDLLVEGGFEPEAVLRTWKDRGWLDVGKNRGSDKRVRIDGHNPWCHVVKRSAIDGTDKDDVEAEGDNGRAGA